MESKAMYLKTKVDNTQTLSSFHCCFDLSLLKLLLDFAQNFPLGILFLVQVFNSLLQPFPIV